jgi:ABC-type lipoprotein export system ATPase subunit
LPVETGLEPAARCRDVVKTYRTGRSEVRALRGVSAVFDHGTLSAIVGPSGSGKSSLLRLLAGMDRPDAGSIEVTGAELHMASGRTLRRMRRTTVGYVFQRPSDNFFAFLTIGDHLALAAHQQAGRGMDPGEVLDVLQISHRAHHPVSELSGGEQQRAAFAQALVAGAELIIADEPTAELDSASATNVLECVGRMVGLGVSFILATHDRAVTRKADSVVVLEHGEVVAHPPSARAPATRLARRPTYGAGEVSLDPPVLRLHGLSKSYRRGSELVTALRDAQLTMRRSEMVGVVGRSGSGKTTLLHLIAGWERPDRGSVALEGRVAGAMPQWNRVALLPQRLGLIEELTIAENVEYPARLAGVLAERSTLIHRLLEALGLDAVQHRFPRETSLGEQQRAALARALVLTPVIMLADEPTGHQDRGWMERMLDAVRRSADEGTACLLATHDDEVADFVDRVFTMTDGELTRSAG